VSSEELFFFTARFLSLPYKSGGYAKVQSSGLCSVNNQSKSSDLTLANVEALAGAAGGSNEGDGGGGQRDCYTNTHYELNSYTVPCGTCRDTQHRSSDWFSFHSHC